MIEKDSTSLFSSMYTPVSSGQCVLITYIIALDNNGMIEKDNISLFSSMHTPVSSGQSVFIMYIIALITMV